MGYEETLRRLAIRDEPIAETVGGADATATGLDRKTRALVRIGALVATDAAEASYLRPVEAALLAGATKEEVVGVLVAVMPTVGSARVVSAAPRLGLVLGYDVDEALERPPGRSF